MILSVHYSNTTFRCKLISLGAGGCTILRFVNCTLFRVPDGTSLAAEGAQRFDAMMIFDSRHVGSQPTTFSIARTIGLKDEPLGILVQVLCLRRFGLSVQPRWFATRQQFDFVSVLLCVARATFVVCFQQRGANESVCGAGALRATSTKPQKLETCTILKTDPARQRPHNAKLAARHLF
jgi:hypothetical protein